MLIQLHHCPNKRKKKKEKGRCLKEKKKEKRKKFELEIFQKLEKKIKFQNDNLLYFDFLLLILLYDLANHQLQLLN